MELQEEIKQKIEDEKEWNANHIKETEKVLERMVSAEKALDHDAYTKAYEEMCALMQEGTKRSEDFMEWAEPHFQSGAIK